MRGQKRSIEIYQINERWRIDQDSMNYMLQHKGKVEGSESGNTWVTVGYYQTIKQLYHALVEKNMKRVNFNDFKTLMDKIDELHQLIDKASSGIMTSTKEGAIDG